jgi:hypothetical protein
MKRRVAISIIAVPVVTAAVLWLGTFCFGRAMLERGLHRELQDEWQSCRAETVARSEHFPGEHDRDVYPDGPMLKVRSVSCVWPLVVDAELDRAIGGLNGRGTVGRYVVTPWRVYIIRERRTWIS